MPNASWRRRGVATARGGGSPTLGTERSGSGKGEAKRRAAQAKRGSLGKLLAGARGGAPLRSFVLGLLSVGRFSQLGRLAHPRSLGKRCGAEQRVEVPSMRLKRSANPG